MPTIGRDVCDGALCERDRVGEATGVTDLEGAAEGIMTWPAKFSSHKSTKQQIVIILKGVGVANADLLKLHISSTGAMRDQS